ncbi:DsbA family protein [Teichococcus aestuarii]|uniref:DSBA-like thioredoxin domain-containing protein n=1 Tax=Teichococcus aestuarii TaxID=568898 RepID=A0A2U1V4P6_9PROT|nr:DsbA family protein [Pseudoroseomonas aestuarii]PWC28864.1 hypothetical protein CR165_09680 [Pseudoroseomonas aestuarii]
MTILHYIHDPLCGWCYAATALLEAARARPEIRLRMHGGGLWHPAARLREGQRQHILEADARIGALTGQVFGPGYRALLADPETVFHSRPTIAALLAVPEPLAPAMLRAIQRAHYVEGLRVVEDGVLAALAMELGLDEAEFRASLAAAPVEAHINTTRRLMQRVGATSFPTFLAERDGNIEIVPHMDCYEDPAAFVARL